MRFAFYIESHSYNPYHNLALEEALLSKVELEMTPALFFWQNDKTVVIGRNQNAFTECNVEYLQHNGYCIARRKTGGGAVYHDKGNLNYSIVLPKELYDITTSTSMIVDALNDIGINAEATGRNDICCNGYKLSGNAYHSNNLVGLHHGTILLSCDTNIMQSVLNVPSYKKTYTGIKSVRSRVRNIKDINPEISLEIVKQAIKSSFLRQYGFNHFIELTEDVFDTKELEKNYAASEWNLYSIRRYNESATIVKEDEVMVVSIDYDRDSSYPQVSISSDGLNLEEIKEAESMLRKILDSKSYQDVLAASEELARVMNWKNCEIRGYDV